MREIDYLWEHWKFNADQRIKAFNFFVVFSVFANGGVFAAVEKCVHPVVTRSGRKRLPSRRNTAASAVPSLEVAMKA
jgi:hypothetical protein